MAEPRSANLHRLARGAVVVAVFVAALLGSRAVVAGLEIRPAGGADSDVFTGKMDYLAENVGRYDTLVVGSSRTFRAFEAAAFDEAMAAQGIAVRSFNLGMPGLNGIEARYVIRRVLEMEGQDLRRLIVAPAFGFRVELDERLARHDRVVVWHDLEGTSTAVRAVLEGDGTFREKSGWVFHNIDAFLTNVLGIGRVANRLVHRQVTPDELILGPGVDGHVSLDYVYEIAPTEALDERRERNADVEQFDKIVRAVVRNRKEPPPEPNDWELEFLESMLKIAEEHDLEVVFLLEPVAAVNRNLTIRWAADRDDRIRLLDFSDPADHPDLYEHGLYWDRNHLNAAGAAAFTQALVEEMVPLLSGDGR